MDIFMGLVAAIVSILLICTGIVSVAATIYIVEHIMRDLFK